METHNNLLKVLYRGCFREPTTSRCLEYLHWFYTCTPGFTDPNPIWTPTTNTHPFTPIDNLLGSTQVPFAPFFFFFLKSIHGSTFHSFSELKGDF